MLNKCLTSKPTLKYYVKIVPRNSYKRGILCTNDLLVLTSLDKLLLILQTLFFCLQCKLPLWGGQPFWTLPFSECSLAVPMSSKISFLWNSTIVRTSVSAMQINVCPFSSSARNFQKNSKNLRNFQNFLPVELQATDLLHPGGQSTVRIGSLCSGPTLVQNPLWTKKK